MSKRAAQSSEELSGQTAKVDSGITAVTVAALSSAFARWLASSDDDAKRTDAETITTSWLTKLRDNDARLDDWLQRNRITQDAPGLVVQLARCLKDGPPWAAASNQHDCSPQDTTAPPDEEPLATRNALLHLCEAVLKQEPNNVADSHHSRDEAWQQMVYNFAYGLSHELNNPLANISTRAGVLLSRCTSQEDRELLSAIVDSAMRGCEMLGDLMLIARPPALALSTVSTAEFLEQLDTRVSLFAQSRGIFVKTSVSENCPESLRWDNNAITEALWCLCRNSIECMSDGGEISISIRGDARAELQIAPNDGQEETPPKVLIEVSDNGPGLSDEAAERCFDIYYSGRESGRGLGIGLSKAERIVAAHGGKISIGNRTSGGVSVIVLLPSWQPE